MIFFDNCCSHSGDKQPLSIFRQLGRLFRPPTLFRILLLFTFLFISIVTHAVQVTLNLKSVPLETAFAEIKKQSGYGFWYEKKDIADLPRVTIDVKNVDLTTVLEACLKGQPLTYQVFDRTVVVKRKLATPPAVVPVRKALQEKVRGKVVDAQTKEPLAGVLVKVKSPPMSVVTNDKGEFELNLPNGRYELTIQYLGYAVLEVDLVTPSAEERLFTLTPSENTLEEVHFVSTGYQQLQKERVTGSFTLIDSTLINRSVGSNIIERLDGVTSGLVFNRNRTQNSQSEFNIRGRSTIFGEDKPLVVLDNFPFEGDLNSINPNDIKNIAILRDAAAASIWGTRAGNGVIVITTYSGSFSSKPSVSINVNTTVFGKPDLYQAPWFSNEEWLDIEQFLFGRGAYNTTLNNRFGYVSEGVAIMDKRRRNLISSADSLRMINELKGNDIRSQMLDHLYRNNFSQQYAVNINGGGENHKYVISGGYDGNLGSRTTDYSDRITLTVNNIFRAIKNKLEITSRINFSTMKAGNNPNAYVSPASPYERLVDGSGHVLPVQRDLRFSYIDTIGGGKLLDWRYYPLGENITSSKRGQLNYVVNTGVNYAFTNWFKLNILYQHQRQNSENIGIYGGESYYVRDLINRYSVINYSAGTVNSPIPVGEIRLNNQSSYVADYGRAQLNFSENFNEVHSLSVMGGFEIRSSRNETAANRLYGFNPETFTNGNAGIDFTRNYPVIYNGGTGRIDMGFANGYQVDRYLSYFGNLSYEFSDRYVLTLSARKDESNLFGVKSNQKGVPLWSAGALWNISKESFYRSGWLPFISFKASYGYSGNVSKDLSAYLTASPQVTNNYGIVYSAIINPPNPSLRWEKIKIINLGLSFATIGNRVSGTIEPYLKDGLDLFGESALAPQTGMATYFGNTASTRTKGIDISLNTINLKSPLQWSTNLNFSVTKDKVIEYDRDQGVNSNFITQTYNNPMVGNPYFSIYSYRWAGLDNIGDPQLYLNGQVSKSYSAVANSTNRSNIRYIGSTVPTTYGNIINNFNYKEFEISFNVTYRLGYYFRRNSLNNALIYSTGGFAQNIDYANRWKQAGDELITSVPALVYPNVTQRTNAYMNADVLIEKGDNIRLQDIRLLWNANKIAFLKKHGVRLKLYSNISNLGYLWVANDLGLDPDVPRKALGTVSPRTNFSFGLKADF
ncbi:SusC/RagA family TonB-linked outer membrane protein [Pedobacter xixiisoli]|uniref:TonB-linked outer membrane protein, SusC/RagA family n=1 Tax=Pedobacter xixiisoli TaxID=1476464 RepID=A0A285ZWA1_9SPHI|nr:SusC/RagA family TonB-linked outer membrane protein [Pedobacter xixiisoli]SOD13918.1 TonB-linked outer membrane protein, SusC/RagA family [Pedobacter xixiisoli]